MTMLRCIAENGAAAILGAAKLKNHAISFRIRDSETPDTAQKRRTATAPYDSFDVDFEILTQAEQ